MKRALMVLMLLIAAVPVLGQDGDDEDYSLRVFVDSAFVRALPDQDAEPVASVFEDDVLEAFGRNADGTWFEVRRPFNENRIGWISTTVVFSAFDVASLPLTDTTTGITGPEPVVDTGISLYFFAGETVLRAAPDLDGERVGVVPFGVTIPALDRSPDNLWIRVNYLGTVGWVAEFLTTTTAAIGDLPINPEFLRFVEQVDLPIIPPEVQLAQVNRLRSYAQPIYETADIVANFWAILRNGDIAPCTPPAGNFPYYTYSQDDFFELPELRRMVNRLETAITDINNSIATMQSCGVYTPAELSRAYAQAINARTLLGVILDTLDVLEEEVIPAES